MKIRKKSCIMGVVLCFIVLAFFPQAIGQPNENEALSTDVFLFINGGFGLYFTVINNGDEPVQAYYAIYGEGFFFNKSWERHGQFTAGPKVRTIAPPVIVPYSVMPITAYLYTNTGEILQRSGISAFGFVLLAM